MDRRGFIALTAISGTSAALAGCGNPEHQLIRFLPDDELVPGVAEWKAGVCPLCRAGCGLQVRVMDGEAEVVREGQRGLVRRGLAKKLEGTPSHPVNAGALCARGQAAIQIAYHPDRLGGPMKRSGARGDGAFAPISWDEAIGELVSRLDALADRRSLAILARPRTGHRQALVAEFARRFGAPPPIAFELFADEVLRRANAIGFGRHQLPTLDLARARFVLAFGADFLGTWNSPVSQSVAYGGMRQGRAGIRGTFAHVERRMSFTGANADEWIPVRTGTDGVLALGLAHVIIAKKLRAPDAAGRAGAAIEGWAAGLPDYAPEAVERRTGVAAARVERLARALVETEPAVVVIGGAPLAHTNGLFTALAVNALNALVGGVGRPGGIGFTPPVPFRNAIDDTTRGGAAAMRALAASLLSSDRAPVQALWLDDANPVFAAPPAWRVREALAKIPFIVSFGAFVDETSVLADLILPDHAFLETWSDAVPESGSSVAVASLAGPAVRPLHDTRAMPDVVLDVGRRLRRPLEPPLPWKTFEEMLRGAYATLPGAGSADEAWTAIQKRGGWWGEPMAAADNAPRTGEARPAKPAAFVEPRFDGDAGQYPFHFLPYPSHAFVDGSTAHLPWLQEMPDPLTSAMWSSWVEINPAVAAERGIAPGDVVEVASPHGRLRAPAIVSPGIAPDVVAMPVGQGHTTFTRVASGRGQNPMSLVGALAEPETGALAWAATRVQIARVGGGGDLLLFAGEMRERPHGESR